MADYLISKDAVQKMLIDLREDLNERYISIGISMALQKMEGFKPADAVEVVRCKECKHRRNAGCPMRSIHVTPYGCKINDSTKDNGFCHKGAKMAGGEEA